MSRSPIALCLIASLAWSCGSPPLPPPNVTDDASTRVDAGDLDLPTVDIPPLDVPPIDTPRRDVTTTDTPPTAAADTSTGTDVPADTGDRDAIVGLRIDPGSTTLRVTSASTPLAQALRALGATRDGRELPVTALWSADRSDVISVDATGLARTSNAVGGDTLVTARYGTLAANATVRVRLELSVTAPGAPATVPAAFPDAATAGSDPARTPAWVYPANETVFPQNVYRVLFQWRRGGGDRFRLTFESDRVRVLLYTDGAHPDCTSAGTGLGCFEPSLDVWRYIAGSNPRGSVRVTVDGTTAASPGVFHRSATLNIAFSRGTVPGAIYYWSTTVQGVRRATVGDAAPTNFLTPTEADRNCVACHTLSRRGNRMAADVGGNNLWIVEASPVTPPRRVVAPTGRMAIPMFWSTFSTDESRIVTAARGVMTLRRTADGGVINTIPLATRTFGTQPDWALDDRAMAFVLSASDRDRGVSGGRIATVEVRPGDTWGAVRTLVGSGANNDTNQFPSFSWDSRWIAYAHSTGNGQNDATTDLWLVRADGTEARALTRANTVINSGSVTTPTIQDNMPTWAPAGVRDDYAWVAFSSTRDYGGVLSGASRLGRHEQLWVAAVHLDEARGTADPSHPAFRVPFQGLNEDNHRPFWALDRVGPSCATPASACMADADCCAPNVCRGGACGAACTPLEATCATSAECCSPAVCIAGVCRTACRPIDGACTSNADCCVPSSCTGGRCVAAQCRMTGGLCTTDGDCCSGGVCTRGLCAAPTCRPAGGSCAMDADCCAPNTCRGGLCRAPCVASGTVCAMDSDCCSPNTCRGGTCRAACTASGGACATNGDCCAPATCTGGQCRAPCVASGAACTSDTDCCSPNACRAGMCAAPCRAMGGICTSAADCCSGVCTRGLCAVPPCRVTGGSCTMDADCCSGVCAGGGCAPG